MSGPSRASDASIAVHQIQALAMAEGFLHSSVLFALLSLEVFDKIDAGTHTAEELSKQTGSRAEALTRLLNAAVTLKLLTSEDGTEYHLSETAKAVLVRSAGENFVGEWILRLKHSCRALLDLDKAVSSSQQMVDFGIHEGDDPASTRQFGLAMHNYATFRGADLAKALDTSGASSLLDVGCGPGTYAFYLGMQNESLSLHLCDLPGMLEVAKEIEARYALPNEVHYLPRDVVQEEIPGSYDLVLISNALHMLGEKASRDVIRRLFDAVNPGGSLVIQAQFVRDDGLGDRWPVLMDMILMCTTAAGRNHSVAETKGWLEEAGFVDVEHRRMSMLNTNSYLRARRP